MKRATGFQTYTTPRFKRAYDNLPGDVQKKVKKAISLLRQNLKHPSLHAKKIGGAKDIWEGRVSGFYRFTFTIEGSSIILRYVGRHDETLKLP